MEWCSYHDGTFEVFFYSSVIGIGYNGFPRGCPDDQLPWAKVGLSWQTKFSTYWQTS